LEKTQPGPRYQDLREQINCWCGKSLLQNPKGLHKNTLTTAAVEKNGDCGFLKPLGVDLEWRNEDRSSL